MNKLVRSIIILLFPIAAFSQKEYFIYLQSESEQPFFVRMSDQTFTSTASGYLILSKLKDTTHAFKVGFPQNKWPEQLFSVAIGSKDHGYLLKHFGDKGWGLFDLQTMNVQMSTSGGNAGRTPVNTGITEVSAFTEILSKAANDPSLREKPVFAVAQEKPQSIPVAAASKPEPVVQRATQKETLTERSDTPVSGTAMVKEELKQTDSGLITKKAAEPLETAATKNTIPATDTPLAKAVMASNQENKGEVKLVSKNTDIDSNETKITGIATKEKTPVTKTDVPAPADKPINKEAEPIVASKTVDSSLSRPDATASLGKEQDNRTCIPVQKEKEDKNTTVPAGTGVASNTGNTDLAAPEYERSEVIKKSESSTTEGFGLTFIDKIADYKQDTIEIVIPNSVSILENAMRSRADDKKFLDITSEDGNASKKQQAPKNNCAAVASENDFFKLRKKMAGEKENEGMIHEAKKEFKSKCFSVEQIRNLGNLLLNEAGKFQFYEAAYPNSSDKAGFTVLQAEFRDPYFVHRFKNLVD